MVAGARRDAWRERLGVGRLELTVDGALIDADEDARRVLPAARPGGDRACLTALAERVPGDGTPLDVTVGVTRGGVRARVRVVAQRIEVRGAEPRVEALLLDLGSDSEPEDHFRHIQEQSPAAMCSIDEDGRFRDVNRAWLELTGYRRDEVIGRDVTFLMTEESARRAAEEVIPRFWRTGSVRCVPYQYVRADGAIVDVELDCDAVVDPSGRRVSVSVVRDVTVRQRALRGLEQRERELRRVLERSADAILLHRDGVVVWANERAADLLEAAEPSELVGQPMPRPLVGEGSPAEEAELQDVRLLRADGGERRLEVVRFTVHFEGRDTSLLIARDLPERSTPGPTTGEAHRPPTVGAAADLARPVSESLASRLFPSRRILVVDDEPALRDLLTEALADRARVVTASSGLAARELLEDDDRFDAILCDLVMPEMNGVELYEWVRSTLPLLTRRIIFMTGAAYTPQMRALLGRVDNQRLDKPFRVRDVERALDRLLGPAVRIHA